MCNLLLLVFYLTSLRYRVLTLNFPILSLFHLIVASLIPCISDSSVGLLNLFNVNASGVNARTSRAVSVSSPFKACYLNEIHSIALMCPSVKRSLNFLRGVNHVYFEIAPLTYLNKLKLTGSFLY